MASHLERYDLNGDGYIDISEIQMVSNAFGACKGKDARYERRLDFNRDGCIDISELMIISSLFGTKVPDDDDDD